MEDANKLCNSPVILLQMIFIICSNLMGDNPRDIGGNMVVLIG